MVDGNSTLVNSMQFSKHLAGMTLIESGMEMVLRLIQPLYLLLVDYQYYTL